MPTFPQQQQQVALIQPNQPQRQLFLSSSTSWQCPSRMVSPVAAFTITVVDTAYARSTAHQCLGLPRLSLHEQQIPCPVPTTIITNFK
ncbi:hypothetical protein DPMN_075221 [Dreissena polymorpha]|uniref:Uncharacterized protein n=1 Tax=Dreissena polymorpha TaxID=45954 RepID=A0A9D4BMB1_DREPO|nr:hypothetical protein DPMN_075221 [Dreissena polymorpha]